MAKKGDRVQVIMECTEHKESGQPGTSRYITTKNRKNTPERLELKKFNPQLLDKQRILTISKSDLLDDELEAEMKAELKKQAPDLNPLFFSSVAQKNLIQLKDQIWRAIDDANPDTGLSKGPFAPLPPPIKT